MGFLDVEGVFEAIPSIAKAILDDESKGGFQSTMQLYNWTSEDLSSTPNRLIRQSKNSRSLRTDQKGCGLCRNANRRRCARGILKYATPTTSRGRSVTTWRRLNSDALTTTITRRENPAGKVVTRWRALGSRTSMSSIVPVRNGAARLELARSGEENVN